MKQGKWERWVARIRRDGKYAHLGYFQNEIEAARAYDRAAVEHHGEFARPNFPNECHCGNCGGAHFIQQCPEIARAIAPMTAVELGASLCGMLWCDPAGFVRLLTRSTPARRAAYASAYVAFLRSERGWCDLTIMDVLARWLPSSDGAAPAMSVAA